MDISDFVGHGSQELTGEEIRDAWAEFTAAHVIGRTIELGDSSGDGYTITACITQLVPIMGCGVILRILHAQITDDEAYEAGEENHTVPLSQALIVFIPYDFPPPKIRESDILLPYGANCTDPSGEYAYANISIGFIQ